MEDNTKTDLNEIEWDWLNPLICLGIEKVTGCSEKGNAPSGYIKLEEFLGKMSKY
jgi:hypothetical protein